MSFNNIDFGGSPPQQQGQPADRQLPGQIYQPRQPFQPQQPGQQQQQPQQPQNPYFGNLGAYTPLPYQAFGGIPQITPQTIQPGQISQFLGPYAGAVEQSMAPMFQQQSESLDADMARRGIFNSGAANASQGNLLAQQFGQVLGQSLPYAQQDMTGNMGAQNQALAANAQAYGNVTQGNEGLYNNFMQELMSGNMNRGNALMGAQLGSYGGPNSGIMNIYGQGAANAGSAYGNAYNQGIGASGPLGNAFGQLFSHWSGAPQVQQQQQDQGNPTPQGF